MLDAAEPLRSLTRSRHRSPLPLLAWRDQWQTADHRPITIGLLDTGCDRGLPDLAGADLVVRDFIGAGGRDDPHPHEHGTRSVAVLIGQGHASMRGLVPRARLLLGAVFAPDGVSDPDVVARAIHWLLAERADVIALPLGDALPRPAIDAAIVRAAETGVPCLAAAGNAHPAPLLFPARHPLAIAVGAGDRRGRLLPTCSRLPRLDVIAPGWRIVAPVDARRSEPRSGTSIACVLAAGAAALAIAAASSTPSRAHVLAWLRGVDHDPRAPPAHRSEAIRRTSSTPTRCHEETAPCRTTSS
jgi:subtilisin family serine protease